MTAPTIATDDAVLADLLALRERGMPGWKCIHLNLGTATISMRFATPADVTSWREAMASTAELVPEQFPTLVFHYVNVADWRPGWTVYMTAVVDLYPDAAANVAAQVTAGSWGEWPS